MLILAGLLMLLGSGSSGNVTMLDTLAQVHKTMPKIIQDQQREGRAMEVVAEMRSVLKKNEVEYRSLRTEFLRVESDYEVGLEQYQEIDRRFEKFWRTSAKEWIRLRFDLRDQLTRDEWSRLFKALDHPGG